MHSIRKRIQNTLMGSIVFVGVCAFGVLFVDQQNVIKNQDIIDRMTTEYSINSMTDKLILSYNDAVKSTGDLDIVRKYEENRQSLMDTIDILETKAVSGESKSTLIGVENTVNSVISECDAGLKEVQSGNFDNLSGHFNQANINNDFVRSNVQNLLQRELEYLSANQTVAKKVYLYTVIISGSLFGLILFLTIFYAGSFSKQLVSPVEQLSQVAKQVASGDMDFTVDKKLLDQKDEVGVLSGSFVFMVETIKTKIAELNTSKEALEKGNKELEKLNSFMVGRELKMVELKKKISELEKTK